MEKIRKLYCQNNGRPTKELRSVTGAFILQHLYDLTDHDTCQRFLYDNLWIEALDLDAVDLRDRYISPRTLWDHSKKLAGSGLLDTILNSINERLIEKNCIEFQRQRLDSVQINGNMAKLSRIQLFHATAKAFLRDLRRKHKGLYEMVGLAISDKYLSDDKKAKGSSYQVFGGGKPGERGVTLKGIAKDIYTLIELFKDQPEITNKQSFKNLQRLFSDQCVVTHSGPTAGNPESHVQVGLKEPKEISGNALQNPSDPDATYSGHKGQGYHVQLMETCGTTAGDENKTLNIITYVHVEGADVHDGKSTIPAIEAAAMAEAKPEVVLADTSYGSDANHEKAKEMGVELIAPVGGKDPEADKARLADFIFQDDEVIACPEGQKPWATKTTNGGKTIVGFNKSVCDNCAKAKACPVSISGDKAQLAFDHKDLRLSRRRAREQTAEFKEQYAMRSGIEATNSRLARETKLKKLRYRRLPKIRFAVFLKVIGLNFKRVYSSAMSKKRQTKPKIAS
jgi:hypothetical protein